MWKQAFDDFKAKAADFAASARTHASEVARRQRRDYAASAANPDSPSAAPPPSSAPVARRVEAEGPTWTADLEAQDAAILERIKSLPSSVGVTLMTAGLVGAVLPGSVGTPLVVAGGLVLAPNLFDKVDGLVKHRFPGLHHEGLKALARFLDDFERRFPPEADGPKVRGDNAGEVAAGAAAASDAVHDDRESPS